VRLSVRDARDDRTLLDKEGKSRKTLGQKHREEFILDVAAMANGEGGKIYTGGES